MCVGGDSEEIKKIRKKEREHMDMENSMVILGVLRGMGGDGRGHMMIEKIKLKIIK